MNMRVDNTDIAFDRITHGCLADLYMIIKANNRLMVEQWQRNNLKKLGL